MKLRDSNSMEESKCESSAVSSRGQFD